MASNWREYMESTNLRDHNSFYSLDMLKQLYESTESGTCPDKQGRPTVDDIAGLNGNLTNGE